MDLTKSPQEVFLGNPPSALHQPSQAETAQLLDEMVAEIEGLQAPVADLDTRVTAVEGIATSGAVPKGSVATVALTNITLSGVQTVAGVASDSADAVAKGVLVVGQSAPAENGVWTPAAGAWTRRADLDAAAEFAKASVRVDGGTYAGRTYWQTATVTTLGTDAVVWSMIADDGPRFAEKANAADLEATDTRTAGVDQSGADLPAVASDDALLLDFDPATGRVNVQLTPWALRRLVRDPLLTQAFAPLSALLGIEQSATLTTPSIVSGDAVLLGWEPTGLSTILSDRTLANIQRRLGISGGAAFDPVASGLIPRRPLSLWGDSNVQNGLPAAMAAFGWTVNGRGIGGQDIFACAARQGSYPITITLPGNVLPASGAVSVTAKAPNVLYQGGVFMGSAKLLVAGQACTITTDGSGNWTLTRDVAGSEIAVPAGSEVYVHPDLGTSFIPAWEPRRADRSLLWGHRNNIPTTRQGRRDQMAVTAGMVRHLTPTMAEMWIVSICNAVGEGSATSGYANIRQMNDLLADAAGARYIKLREYFVERAIYDMIDDGVLAEVTTDDAADMAADTPPRSILQLDGLHFATITYPYAAAYISECMWSQGVKP